MLTGLGLVLICILLFFGSLSWLTGNGKVEKVPSVVGQNILAAKKILEDKGFDVIIQDSVYVDSVAKQAVLRQIPEADALVKSGRNIYLTVNRTIPPQVEMPNLAGFSVKSAEMYLISLGLKMGEVSYRPIKPGTKIPIGTVISFVLGSGEGTGEMSMPELVGMTFDAAKSFLQNTSLTLGSVLAIGPIKDSASAFVIRQSPAALSDSLGMDGLRLPNKIKQGQSVDIYISSTPPPKTDSTGTVPNNN